MKAKILAGERASTQPFGQRLRYLAKKEMGKIRLATPIFGIQAFS